MIMSDSANLIPKPHARRPARSVWCRPTLLLSLADPSVWRQSWPSIAAPMQRAMNDQASAYDQPANVTC